ncbi:DUF2628 domain-containing protein [Acidisphaera sp. L21]|uniref:DUF2628 domain-containing protein n=1 Tax=Acidisphaera sp. L21 TaxID=1641851 RepID=UPI00131D21E3|nr:DUF2628 domain-containing protein [Acidisphaera sp. L21]
MKTFTVHLHQRKMPILVPEAFAWGALFFGPIWLLLRGAWIAALIALAVLVLVCTVVPPELRPVLFIGTMVLLGLLGHDLRRAHLGLMRYQLSHVVAARNNDEALYCLLSYRTDLMGLAV